MKELQESNFLLNVVGMLREDLLLFSYFAFAGKNMKSQCRNHLFFSLNFFKP